MQTAEKTCEGFLSELAAKVPAPGGGGAAALAGALGAALGSMVANYTIGKKKYAAVEEDVKGLLCRAEELRRSLLSQVDADAAAFEPLSRAYAIPKEDPGRAAVMEECLWNAAAVPMTILRLACEAVEIHSELLEKGSTMVLSDVGTGAALCRAAIEGALLNVKVNTGSMADKQRAAALEKEAQTLAHQYGARATEIYEAVLGRYA